MKKQDRQGVRTASDLERKYAIGQSFKKAQGGIQKAAEDASIAKEQAKNANAGLEGLEKNILAAKALAEDAADAAFRAENKVDNLNLSVDNGSVTAEITLMVGDVEIKRTIHMQGLASLLALKTAGEVQVNGKNIVGTVELTGEQDEEGNWKKVEVSPEGVKVKLLEENEAAEEVESACAELSPVVLMLQGKHAGFEVAHTEGQEDAETGEITGQGITMKLEDFLTGAALRLLLQSGKVRISGLTEPEEDTDAVNKAYIDRELAKLRQELGLNQE